MTGILLTPGTLTDAVSALQRHPRSQLVAGGTDVVADLNRGRPPTGLLSLRDLAELTGITRADARWWIGAMTTIADVRADTDLAPAASALGQAARSLGSRQVRNRATVGGNICGGGSHRTLVPVLLAYDATVDVVGPEGPRTQSLADLLASPGACPAVGEILTAISFSPATGPQRYYRIGPRNALCYATASVTVVVDEPTRSVRVALGGVAETAVRAPAAEDLAREGIDWQRRSVDTELAREFGGLAAQAAQPVSDFVASAQYRRHAVEVMARRALKHIFEEVSGE